MFGLRAFSVCRVELVPSLLQPVVDVMKVRLHPMLHAASDGVKLTHAITPLDGSGGVKYSCKNVL